MACSLGTTATLAVTLAAGPVVVGSDSPPTGEKALVVGLSPFAESVVRRAIEFAFAKLARSECREVYSDFALEGGHTPQDELDRLGMGPGQLLKTIVFVDGSRHTACEPSRVAMFTKPGSRAIWVCPSFTELHLRYPGLSASLIIHESLHALGLGEDPPSASEITRAVERRCWRR